MNLVMNLWYLYEALLEFHCLTLNTLQTYHTVTLNPKSKTDPNPNPNSNRKT